MSSMSSMSPGLILVFDMDQTLVDTNSLLEIKNAANSHTYFNTFSTHIDSLSKVHYENIEKNLNTSLIDGILKPAIEQRKNNGTVSAILLLTNNSHDMYIKNVLLAINNRLGLLINNKLGKVRAFDKVFSRNRGGLNPTGRNPPKRLADVEEMLSRVGKPFLKNTLASRVYFFDDHHEHKIKNEIANDHYFTVKWPSVSHEDTTNYTSILTAIKAINGSQEIHTTETHSQPRTTFKTKTKIKVSGGSRKKLHLRRRVTYRRRR